MIKEPKKVVKNEVKSSSKQKTYYEFIQYLMEDSDDVNVTNETIDFDDYSK